jgi:hypothetical protein
MQPIVLCGILCKRCISVFASGIPAPTRVQWTGLCVERNEPTDDA